MFIFCALLFLGSTAQAQVNSWIGTNGGDWESPQWSLGLPGTNQDILIAPVSPQTIVIEPATVINYPQSLYIGELTIASVNGQTNELWMNEAGLETPLVIGDLVNGNGSLEIDTNAVFNIAGSSLVVCNSQNIGTLSDPGEFRFTIGGLFNETDGSSVVCSSVFVGGIGPGVFNLNNYSSFQASGTECIGFNNPGLGYDDFPSTINQYSGSNTCTLLWLNVRGNYNLYNGWFSGSVQLNGGQFIESGGNVSGGLSLLSGSYSMNDGMLNASTINIGDGVPVGSYTNPSFDQTGGIIYANSIDVEGTESYSGSYNLSGGLLYTTNVTIGSGFPLTSAVFTQSGGVHSNISMSIVGENYSYTLNDGGLESGSIEALFFGSMNQNGGYCLVDNFVGNYNLTGGYFNAQTMALNHFGQNCIQSGGSFYASNVLITSFDSFQHAGGYCFTPLLTLDGGMWWELTNVQVLGQLQLGESTNSIIQFPTNGCYLFFADSSGLTWSNSGVLTILNWNGSTNGFGSNTITFGTNANGLTPMQLAQIQFANPAGFPPGYYTAQIVDGGQLVPGDVSYLFAAPGPFFTGEAALGNEWYYLSVSNQVFGYYSLEYFPYIYHADMGWEYFIDAGDASHGAYFYDFTDSAWVYTQPASFPYIYDFNQNAWLYYLPSAAGRYSSNPRWFYNFSTSQWGNHL